MNGVWLVVVVSMCGDKRETLLQDALVGCIIPFVLQLHVASLMHRQTAINLLFVDTNRRRYHRRRYHRLHPRYCILLCPYSILRAPHLVDHYTFHSAKSRQQIEIVVKVVWHAKDLFCSSLPRDVVPKQPALYYGRM